MFGIGPMELVVILVMALLVLGPKRMPELARTLGRGLGEFRRASSELRQSLALDDLQNELRDGLAGVNSIHKPEDRPAQAGDDLDPGKSSNEESSDSEVAPKKHPGELPLDEDPTTHHDVSEEAPEEAPEAGNDSAPKTRPGRASGTPAAADSELGNVPVGGAGLSGGASKASDSAGQPDSIADKMDKKRG